MNQLFDDFFSPGFSLSPFGMFGEPMRAFSPQLDISENDDEITVAAELPGMNDNDIQVTLTNNTLTISGEKKEEKEDKGKNYYHLERSFGSFRRSLSLSSDIEPDKVDAVFKNGVLTITLPKSAKSRAQQKRITVKHA